MYFWSDENSPPEPVHVHVSKGILSEATEKAWITRSGKRYLVRKKQSSGLCFADIYIGKDRNRRCRVESGYCDPYDGCCYYGMGNGIYYASANWNKRHQPEELSGLGVSKGTIRVPYDQPLPAELIERIAKWCYEKYAI